MGFKLRITTLGLQGLLADMKIVMDACLLSMYNKFYHLVNVCPNIHSFAKHFQNLFTMGILILRKPMIFFSFWII